MAMTELYTNIIYPLTALSTRTARPLGQVSSEITPLAAAFRSFLY